MNSFNLQNRTRRTPYRVPDGYFDSLTSRVMQSLPDTNVQTANQTGEGERIRINTHSHGQRWLGWGVAAAACFAATLMFVNMPHRDTEQQQTQTATASVAYDEDYEQQVLDYAMLDDTDIYTYMSGGI